MVDLIEAFLKHKQQTVESSRYNQLLVATRAIEEELGNSKPIAKITREECQAIADLFVTIPPYATRHYPNMTLRQAAEAHEAKHGEPAKRHSEADKHLAVLRSLLEFAVDQDWIDKNPASKVRIVKPKVKFGAKDDEGYLPFTIDELKVIFDTPLYRGCVDDTRGINKPGPNKPRRAKFWLPLISLFSGLRAQEILQLEKSDIREEDGVPFLRVTDLSSNEQSMPEGYVKKLKRRNSLRRVPIHHELVRIGFLDFVREAEQEWLFPEMGKLSFDKMSNNFSRKFSTFLKPTGVWVRRKKVFHSFRSTFNDALRRAEVPTELREPISGWVDQSKMDSRYGAGHTIKRLSEQVNKASYEDLDLSFLYTNPQ